jgi:GGDEF domain-containing protein
VTLEDPVADGRFLDRGAWYAEVNAARSSGRHAGFVLYFNVEQLILVTDGLGYPAGDDVAEAVANRLVAAVPPDAVICCWGGQQYAVLVRCTTLEAAQRIGDCVVDAVEAPVMVRTYYDVGGETLVVPLTPRISWGVADCSRPEYVDAQACLAAADDGMSRGAGRMETSLEAAREYIREHRSPYARHQLRLATLGSRLGDLLTAAQRRRYGECYGAGAFGLAMETLAGWLSEAEAPLPADARAEALSLAAALGVEHVVANALARCPDQSP